MSTINYSFSDSDELTITIYSKIKVGEKFEFKLREIKCKNCAIKMTALNTNIVVISS
jgi:hypothetical protein